MVEVCSICDIAGCHHIRERTGPFTPKPDPRDAEIARLTAELEAARVGLNTAWADRDMHCRRAEKAEADLATARAETAARDDIIGSWLSAALEDPNAGDAFKADVRRWFETSSFEALAADRKAVRAETVAALINVLHCCDTEARAIANRIAGPRGMPNQCPDGVQVLEDAETIIRAAAALIEKEGGQ